MYDLWVPLISHARQCKVSGMAIVMFEDFSSILARVRVPSEYLGVRIINRLIILNELTVVAWKSFCPRYNFLTPGQL